LSFWNQSVRTVSIGLLTAIVSAVFAVIGGDLTTRAHGVSNMEGGRAMAIVFLIAPAGALVGLIVGLVAARKVRTPGGAGFAKALALAIGVAATLGLVVFGYSWWRAPHAPEIDGHTLDLEFEVRMPAGRDAPAADAGFTVLMTSNGQGDDRRNADLKFDALSRSEDRVVLPASAFLYTTTRQRFLVVNDVDGKHYWFDLPLRARPRAEDQSWSDWWPAPGKSATADVNGNGGFQIRYRVQPSTR